ncbi:MAG: Ferritin Dps family protein [Gammaproteobacteria bacterium]|jgi:starvation-inducible DNA-binding protein|nr:Ferritin Dps family protein [Gammaproteobacteria bacterium]
MSDVTQGLSVLLADTFALYLKTHKYHWNVEGKNFFELHTFFEKLYNEAWEAVDEIAERIRSLGGYAPGSFQEFSQLSTIKDGATQVQAEDMIKDLLAGHEVVIGSAKKVLADAEKVDDAATADFVTARIEAHQKNAWMLKSFLK